MDSVLINLKKIIDESDLSINKISQLAGIPYSTLSDLINGKRKNISFQNIILICDVLNCPIDYLTGRNGMDYNEMKVIEKYRQLDERGKNNINGILDIEIKNKDILV